MTDLAFLIPGDLAARTGGTGYDRRLIAELGALGIATRAVALPGDFPQPAPSSRAAAAAALAAVPDGGVALIDGLAGAVLAPELEAEAGRVALVFLCHHPVGLEAGLPADAARRLIEAERRALAAVDAVVVTSPATARTLADDFAVPAARITVAVPGTDPAPAAPASGDPPVLLTLASLIPRKGHDVLVAALARLRDRRWTARFVGGEGLDPAHAARIRALVAAEGLSGRIAFAGAVDDPAVEYAGADVFVLPSRYEGYGMAFAEAMARGLPIVAARAGAVPDVVPPEAGLLVPPDDPDALAAALALVLDDKAARARYREGARAAAGRFPTWSDTAARVAAVVRTLGAA